MVDEDAFKKTLRSNEQLPCPFGKAVLARCCDCAVAGKLSIAERESVHCTRENAHEQCVELFGQLRRNAMFALRLVHPDVPLTHAGNMKLQCGGLFGLQFAMDGSRQVSDVSALVAAAIQAYGSLEELPYSQIMQSVSAFRLRREQEQD